MKQPAAVTRPYSNALMMLAFLAAFAFLLELSLSELNPDWLAYQLIYDAGGAWLSENGRDPLFLALTAALKDALGPEGYENYRLVLAVYFFGFMALATAGKIIPIHWQANRLFIGLALAYLGLARFTIQVREGVAITIALLALGLIKSRSQSKTATSTGSIPPAAWGLLLAAATIHAATVVLPLGLLLAQWLGNTGLSLQARQQRLTRTMVVALLGALTLAGQLALGGLLLSVSGDLIGDRFTDSTNVGLLPILLWSIYGLICVDIYRQLSARNLASKFGNVYLRLLIVLAGPAAIGAYAAIVLAMLFGVSPILYFPYVRLLYLLLTVSVLGLVCDGRVKWSTAIATAFLISDQARGIVESVSIYFGVDLLSL